MNAIKNKVGNMKIKRSETSPLEKFKYQSTLTKKFGKRALIIYNAIPLRKYRSIDEIKEEVEGFSDEEIEKIIKFMEERGMISVKESKVEREETEKQKQEAEEVTKEEIEEKVEEEAPVEEEKELEIEQPTPSQELQTTQEVEAEEEQEKPEEEIEIKPASLEESEEDQEKPEEEIEIKPASLEQSQDQEEEKETTSSEERIDVNSLSPLESELYTKFGELGVKVYRKAREGYTVDEIFSEFVEEREKISPIVDFLKELGYIEEKKQEEEEREKFAPMADYVEEEEKLAIDKENEIRYISKVDDSIIKKAREKMLCSLKFGKEGSIVFSGINKGVDVISILKKTKVKISIIEKVLDFLIKEKYIETKSYNREEIKNKFGEDSYIIYKKYGKIGLLFYELIGEDMHLKDIATLLEIKDKDKVVEIFMFIHDLLNIEVPIDRQLLLKKLE